MFDLLHKSLTFADSLHCFTCSNLTNDDDCRHVNQCVANEVIMCVCICIVFVHMFDSERERERERQTDRQTDRQTESKSERERESE